MLCVYIRQMAEREQYRTSFSLLGVTLATSYDEWSLLVEARMAKRRIYTMFHKKKPLLFFFHNLLKL